MVAGKRTSGVSVIVLAVVGFQGTPMGFLAPPERYPFLLVIDKIQGWARMAISRGRLAQLVRASGLHPEGRGFESLTAHCVFFLISLR